MIERRDVARDKAKGKSADLGAERRKPSGEHLAVIRKKHRPRGFGKAAVVATPPAEHANDEREGIDDGVAVFRPKACSQQRRCSLGDRLDPVIGPEREKRDFIAGIDRRQRLDCRGAYESSWM